MPLAFIKNGLIDDYPIGVIEVKRKYPNVSFAEPLEDQDLLSFGVVTVNATPQPQINPKTEKLKEGAPILSSTGWVQSWQIVSLSAEELQEVEHNEATRIRSERNGLLASCDWTQLIDAPVDAATWAIYRQALRDITSQPGFPWEITWPTEPTT